MNIAIAIKHKYPDLKENEDYLIQDDGDGQYISKWPDDLPKPTDEELQTAWDEYNQLPKETILDPIQQLQKDQADLTFQLMTKGVI